MRKSGSIRRQFGEGIRQLSEAARVSRFLRLKYPERTAVNVSADTGGKISAKTIEKWLERSSAPSFAHAMLLIATYGSDFICACMDNPPACIREARSLRRRRAIEKQIAALSQQLEDGH